MLNGDIACGVRGVGELVAGLPQIIAGLWAAGGATPEYAEMTYYDPGLDAWVSGQRAVAAADVARIHELTIERLARRIVWGQAARKNGITCYLEYGQRVG